MLDKLPLEIHWEIMRYLNQPELATIACVCKTLRLAACDSNFWETVTLRDDQNWKWVYKLPISARNNVYKLVLKEPMITESNILQLVNLFPSVRVVNINFHHCESSRLLNRVLEPIVRWKNLTAFYIYFNDIGLKFNKTFKLIARKCPNIEDIRVMAGGDIGDSSISTLVKHRGKDLKGLTVLALAFTEKSFKSLSRCLNMSELCLYFPNGLTDKSITFLKQMPHLKVLKIRGPDERLTANGMEKLFREVKFNNLITIYFCLPFSDEAFDFLSKSCPILETLSLYLMRTDEVSDSGLIPILMNLRNLKKLEICESDEITGDCFKNFLGNCPTLNDLSFKECSRISNTILTDLKHQRPTLTLYNDEKLFVP